MKLNIKKIKRELLVQGLNYAKLGRKMGVSRQAVEQYMANPESMTFKTLTKIAKTLELDPKDLLI